MTSPSPIALAIASAVESALASTFVTLAIPLITRIEELEKHNDALDNAAFDAAVITAIRNQPATVVDFLADEIDKRAPTDEFIERAVNAVLKVNEFNAAVLSVVEDRSEDAVEHLKSELKELIDNNLDLDAKITDVINKGSFSVEFARY